MLTAACHSWVVDDDGDGAHSVRIVPVSCVQGDKGASSSTSLSGEGEISVCPLMIVADRVGGEQRCWYREASVASSIIFFLR